MSRRKRLVTRLLMVLLLQTACLLAPGASAPTMAQSSIMNLNEAEPDSLAGLAEATNAAREETAQTAPLQSGGGHADGLLFVGDAALQQGLAQALYRDYQRTLDHNYDLFRWQLFSTKASFLMTILLVLSGLVFSAMQFWKSHKTADAGEPAPTELELSGGRVKVSSPVLGVVILVISLGFFYLFMIHAYPIEAVRRAPPPPVNAE